MRPAAAAAGKKWIDAAVDLPFALPTSVAGLTLATVYGEEGILGRFLMKLGVDVVYTRLGVAVAMIFVSFPFVVRTMQPVLQVGCCGCVGFFVRRECEGTGVETGSRGLWDGRGSALLCLVQTMQVV
jgi:hypothetical protein